jgi:hypothetical protein
MVTAKGNRRGHQAPPASRRTGSHAWAPGPVPAELVRLAVLLALAVLVIGLVLPALVGLAERATLA